MLKQYKRLLYIFSVVIFYSLLYYPAFSQSPVTKVATVCEETAMPVDLFNVLSIQISKENGYWIDKNGNVVDNIFLTEGLNAGTYSFTFTVTRDNYCAPAGTEYKADVTIEKNQDLHVDYTPLDPAWCGLPNGKIVIDSISKYSSGSFKYMLVQKGSPQNDTIIDWTEGIHWGASGVRIPVLVSDSLSAGEYYLYVHDYQPSIFKCYASMWVDTIQLTMAQQNAIVIDTVLIINPTVDINGKFVVEGKHGSDRTDIFTYVWYPHDPVSGHYNPNDTLSVKPEVATEAGKSYWVVVTDSKGCTEEQKMDAANTTVTPKLQTNYYFCQANYVEMYSNLLIDSRNVIDSMLFKTTSNPGFWSGCTITVYASKADKDAGGSPEEKNAWLTKAIDDTGGNVTKYIVITSSTGAVILEQEIKVAVSSRPDFMLSARIFDNNGGSHGFSPLDKFRSLELDIKDILEFMTTPDTMDAYIYYLNNNYLDTIWKGDPNLQVGALKFSGTVQDMMKVYVLDSITKMKVETSPEVKDSVCMWIVSEPIIVNIPFPNTFTPDGDGINDVFLGGDKFGSREFNLEIINRYGHSIYKGSKGWDGTHKGTLLPSGAYFYIVHMKMEDGTTKTLKGAVTLIRKER